jgi:folylpolyglutamate synthase
LITFLLLKNASFDIVGVYFKKALFVPSLSVYNKVGSQASTTLTDSQVDLSWQIALQRVWENLMQGNKGIDS